MTAIPKTIESRISKELRKYQKILQMAKDKDINESDTVTIITDMLGDIFGYDKYTEVTTEYAIKGGYCDLAVKVDERPHYLIEVKAVGVDLKEQHLRQAISYAAKDGVDWIILTNGIVWKAHHVTFDKPISTELLFDIDLSDAKPRDKKVIECLYLLTKEGIKKTALDAYHDTVQATNKFTIAAIIMSEPFLKAINREVKKLSKNVKTTPEDIIDTLRNDVIKRDAMDAEKMKQVNRHLKKIHKQ